MTGNFSGLGFGMAISLTDKFSPAAKNAAASMNMLSSTADKLDGEIGNLMAGFGAAFALGSAINLAAKMSDTMTDLMDVTGMTATEANSMRAELEALDTRTSLEEQLGVAQLGHQLGIANDQLAGFVEMSDKIGASLSGDFGSVEQAAQSTFRLAQSFSDMKNADPAVAMGNVANALDAMADNARVSAQDVSQFALKLAQSANVSSTAAIGMGTALLELGIKAKPASAALMQLSQKAIDPKKAGDFAKFIGVSTDEVIRMGNASPDELFMKVAESLSQLPAEQQASALAELGIKGGQTGTILKVVAKNSDLVKKRMEMASDAITNQDGILGAFDAKNENLAGTIDRLVRAFTNLWTRVGEVIGRALMPLMEVVIDVSSAITAFLGSPIGQEVGKWAGAIIGGTVALIALHKGIGLVRTGFDMMKVAARGAIVGMAPMLLVAAPIIALASVIMKANEAFAEFDGTVKDGFGGFLQRAGGIIATIREVWSSWDTVNQRFSLSEGLLEKLDKLGVRQLALNIATWVVRIKEFFGGLFSGIVSGFKFVAGIVSAVFSPIVGLFKMMGFQIGKTTSATKAWGKAGKIAGGIIVGIMTLLLIKMAAMAIASALAFAPMLLAIGAITLAIYGLYKAFQWLVGVFQWIWSYIKPFFEFGANLMSAIWEGMKSIWASLKSWWDWAMSYLSPKAWIDWMTGEQEKTTTDRIVDIAKGAKSAINAGQGDKVAQEIAKQITTYKLTVPENAKSLIAQSGLNQQQLAVVNSALSETGQQPIMQSGIQASKSSVPNTTINMPPQKTPATKVELTLDGRVLGESMIQYQDEQQSRK